MEQKKKSKIAEPKARTLDQQFDYISSLSGKGGTNIQYTSELLRGIVASNNILRIVIDRVKHRVSKTNWFVRPKDQKDTTLENYCKYVETLLDNPNQEADDTFRSLISKLLEDILVLDRGVIEKVRNSRGAVVELFNVDGGTIKSNIDEYGLYKEPAFSQYIKGYKEPVAQFEADDIMLFMNNPRNEVGQIGYGYSPVQNIISTVITSLEASIYNGDYFDSSKIPPMWVNLPGVSTDELIRFKQKFEESVRNGKNWDITFTNGDNMDMKPLRPSNQDMQFYELNLWLARIICAEYEISPQEIGLTQDVNRATAQVQKGITSEGIDNMLVTIAEEINTDLIGDLARNVDKRFRDVEFCWDVEVSVTEKERAEIDKILIETGLRTIDELRLRDGLEPMEKTTEELLEKNRVKLLGK